MNHELTITYRGRTFTVRADDLEDGWTEAIAEVIREGETAEWDGSGLRYKWAVGCLTESVRIILDTVDEDAGETA